MHQAAEASSSLPGGRWPQHLSQVGEGPKVAARTSPLQAEQGKESELKIPQKNWNILQVKTAEKKPN